MSPEGKARSAPQYRRTGHGSGPRGRERLKVRRSARNSHPGLEGPSVRELQAELAGVFTLITRMAATRNSLMRAERKTVGLAGSPN